MDSRVYVVYDLNIYNTLILQMYKNAHAAIRANPDAQPKKPKKAGKPKRYKFDFEIFKNIPKLLIVGELN